MPVEQMEQINADVQFSDAAKTAVINIGKMRRDKRGRIVAALLRVVAADAKDEVNEDFKNKAKDLRTKYTGEDRKSLAYLDELAELERVKAIRVIETALRDIADAADDISSRIPDVVTDCKTLLQRPGHTMSHGTKAADFVADLSGVVLDSKRAIATSVAAATATYEAEIAE